MNSASNCRKFASNDGQTKLAGFRPPFFSDAAQRLIHLVERAAREAREPRDHHTPQFLQQHPTAPQPAGATM